MNGYECIVCVVALSAGAWVLERLLSEVGTVLYTKASRTGK